MTAEELKEIMLKDNNTWVTLNDLTNKAGVQQSEIKKLINTSSLFVRSASTSKEGEDLFSTKEEFQKKGSFAQKFLGAFKNRID